jgi:hypothetical protein
MGAFERKQGRPPTLISQVLQLAMRPRGCPWNSMQVLGLELLSSLHPRPKLQQFATIKSHDLIPSWHPVPIGFSGLKEL